MAEEIKSKTITIPEPLYDRIKAISEKEQRTIRCVGRMSDGSLLGGREADSD